LTAGDAQKVGLSFGKGTEKAPPRGHGIEIRQQPTSKSEKTGAKTIE